MLVIRQDKKEASTLIATYVKASQAYYTEFGTAAQNAANLSEHIQITGCSQATTTQCASSAPVAVTSGTTWNAQVELLRLLWLMVVIEQLLLQIQLESTGPRSNWVL